jgi:hypothetical protein
LDVLSPDNRSTEADDKSQAQINTIAEAWQVHQDELSSKNAAGNEVPETMQPVVLTWGEYGSRFCRNFSLLYQRAFTEQRRDLPTLGIKLFFTLFFGSLLGGIYSNNTDNQKGIQNIRGLLFVITSK